MIDKLILFLVELTSNLLKGRSHEEMVAYAKAKRERKIFRKADRAFWKEMDKLHKNDPIGYAYFVNDYKEKYQSNIKALNLYIEGYKEQRENKQ